MTAAARTHKQGLGAVREPGPVDHVLVLAVFLLLGVGLVMVYSASVVEAETQMGDGFFYLRRQLIWALVGLVMMYMVMHIRHWQWARWAPTLLVLGLIGLVAVLVPGIGSEVGGVRRWIDLKIVAIQPSEIMKIVLVIWLADFLTRRQDRLHHFRQGLGPPLLILAVVFGLIMLEPDLGTALAIAATVVLMLFVAGARVWHLIGLGLCAVPAVLALIWLEPYRMRRLTAFLDPWQDAQDAGYQIIQSLYALGSGGLFGVGLGRSRQKFFYLPEHHTDFIYAILGEELGFIGAALVLLLFFVLAWRGVRIALAAPDRFSSLLAVGLTTMITVQAAMNVAVVTSSMPITGIPLPFISYGGSNLLPTMLAVGILLGVSRVARR